MSILNQLKKELEISYQARKIVLECLIIGLFIFLSIFWQWFVVFGLIASVGFILLNRNGKSTYFLIFLLPLLYIFRLRPTDVYYLSFLAVLVIFLLAIKVLLQLIKKQLKMKIALTYALAVLVIYSCIISIGNGFSQLLSFLLGVILLYVITYYKEDLNFKEISFMFLLGILFSIITGLFWNFSSRLREFVPIFNVEGMPRFTGVSINTNVFALDLMVLFGLFIALYMQNRIRILFYPVFLMISLIIPMLLGKTSLIIYIVLLAITIITVLFKHRKFWWLEILIIFTTIGLMFLLEYERMVVLLKRLNINLKKPENGNQINNIQPPQTESGLGKFDIKSPSKENLIDFDYLTTGRFDIIKTYLSHIFTMPRNLIFGYGFNFSYLKITSGSSMGFIMGPHNVYIESLYSLGIIGLILFLIYIILVARSFNKHVIKASFITSLIAPLMFALSLSFLGYRLFNYILLAITVIIQDKSYEKEQNIKKQNDKSVNKGENVRKMDKIKIAILTATYNRGHLLRRCYKSLREQINKNFVWYIIDDGSKDETENIVKEFIKQNEKEKEFKIFYIKKENGGKHTALNRGLREIGEEYVIILDSDDYLSDDAVETIENDISLINDRENFCGIGYLRVDLKGNVIGKEYTEDGIEDTFVNQRYNKNTFGDKSEVFKVDVLRNYPFPEIEGEKFLSESTVWCDMSGRYKMKFFNKGIYKCDYQVDGLSDGVHKRLFNNPIGAALCYKQLSSKEFKFKYRLKYTIAYIVYSLASGKKFKQIKKDYPQNKGLITMFYVPALLYFKKLKRRFSQWKRKFYLF